MAKADASAADDDAWDMDVQLMPGDCLRLSLLPDHYIATRPHLLKRAMTGVSPHLVQVVDGFGYQPDHSSHLGTSLVMLCCENDSLTVLQDWVQRWGVDEMLHHRNDTLKGPLLCAIESKSRRVQAYILGLDGLQLGIPEAAALGKKELTHRLVQEYDALPDRDKWYGLAGRDIAYIYSALSGDEEWVSEWMTRVENVNVCIQHMGHTSGTTSAITCAVKSGNCDLVRLLAGRVDLYPQELLTTLAHHAVDDLAMFRFLVEEMGFGLDAFDEYRFTLLDEAILQTSWEVCRYLLDKVPAATWASVAVSHPLAKAVFRWGPPSVCLQFVDCVSKGDMPLVLRQVLREGNHQMAKILFEKGATIGQFKPPGNRVTLLEEAVSSGSVKTVECVLQVAPDAGNFRHDNGFNCLVAAVRNGSPEVFSVLLSHFSSHMDKPVWNGLSLLMVAADFKSLDMFDFFLEPAFYEAHCRGKLMDVNTVDENNCTVLWHAVASGVFELVDRLLSRREWLGLKECNVPSDVNKLFWLACKDGNFDKLMDCLERHGLSVSGTPDKSFAMTAAQNGALFNCEPQAVRKLQTWDQAAGLEVSPQVLLHEVISNAPTWAVRTGRLTQFVNEFCRQEAITAVPTAVLDQVIKIFDTSLAELFAEEIISTCSSSQDLVDVILKTFLEDKDKAKKPRHPVVIKRHATFIGWLLDKTSMVDVQGVGGNQAADLLLRFVRAGIKLETVKKLFADPIRCTNEKLVPILVEAAERCQFLNVRTLVSFLNDSSDLPLLKAKKGVNVLKAALSKTMVPCAGSCDRFPLIKFILSEFGLDLSGSSDNQDKLYCLATELGNHRIHEWVRGNFDRDVLVEDGEALLEAACKSGHPQIVKWVMSILPKDVSGPLGETPIHFSAKYGSVGLLRLLVDVVGMNPDARDLSDRTALYYSRFGKNEDAMEYLAAVSSIPATGENNDASWTEKEGTSMQILNQWLKTIGSSVGKNIEMNENGISAFTYDDYTIVIEVPRQIASFFIYCAVDDNKFEMQEDSWALLLKLAEPGSGFQLCPSIEATSSEVVFSVSERADEMTEAQFRALLENFIDQMLKVGQLLSACRSKRLISEALRKVANKAPGSDTQVSPAIERRLEMYLAEPFRPESLTPASIDVVKRSLEIQVAEIANSIGRQIPLDSAGRCSFGYDDLIITVSPGRELQFRISTVVWVGATSPELLQKILRLNYLQQETRGGILSARESLIEGHVEVRFTYESTIVHITPTDFRK